MMRDVVPRQRDDEKLQHDSLVACCGGLILAGFAGIVSFGPLFASCKSTQG
jgi:hypothetical protein